MKNRHGKGYYIVIALMISFWALLLFWREQDRKRRIKFHDDEMSEREAEMSEWDFHSNR